MTDTNYAGADSEALLGDALAGMSGTVRVVNPAGSSEAYKYAVSAVGAVLVLALFFKYWRVDHRTLTFEVR